MKYCTTCEKHIEQTHYGLGYGILTVLTFFALIGFIIMVWRLHARDRCPICHNRAWGLEKK